MQRPLIEQASPTFARRGAVTERVPGFQPDEFADHIILGALDGRLGQTWRSPFKNPRRRLPRSSPVTVKPRSRASTEKPGGDIVWHRRKDCSFTFRRIELRDRPAARVEQRVVMFQIAMDCHTGEDGTGFPSGHEVCSERVGRANLDHGWRICGGDGDLPTCYVPAAYSTCHYIVYHRPWGPLPVDRRRSRNLAHLGGWHLHGAWYMRDAVSG